mgnify:CR=1 FL=1
MFGRMEASNDDVMAIFRRCGALLEGHFKLRSGRHSAHFFQCARVGEDMAAISQLAAKLLAQFEPGAFETVVAPAMGGLVIGQEVARQAGARYLFVEKNADGALELRRGFVLRPGERVLVVEDVVTRGGRVFEALDILRAHGADAVAVATLVNRSETDLAFGVPHVSLVRMIFPTYAPDNLPPELADIPAVKPGS